jgi:hypothetical protein
MNVNTDSLTNYETLMLVSVAVAALEAGDMRAAVRFGPGRWLERTVDDCDRARLRRAVLALERRGLLVGERPRGRLTRVALTDAGQKLTERIATEPQA